ncbi:DUF6298 domain-containing protein [Niabella insulamsoli]|uniref:DUF6298 domain-containing protein n=1 Tax=Niabella insulamsoli TaxID=3144874 RepID=UPI0031FE193A
MLKQSTAGRKLRVVVAGVLMSFLAILDVSAQKPKPPKPILPVVVQGSQIKYNADTVTGDRVPDYSYCGYKASNEAIPTIDAKVIVPPIKGDATAAIQSAIDKVASMQPDQNGFRGAVLLSKGIYEVAGHLHLKASGIVLRGFGAKDETVIKGTGVERNGLISVSGKNDKQVASEKMITQPYVPVGATAFGVEDISGLRPGDDIQIKRPSTQEWIETLGTQSFGGGISALGWKPGDVDLYFDRKIVAIDGKKITIDVPITTSLDQKFGGGLVAKYSWPGRIHNIGIENLTLISDYDPANLKDEQHRWIAINFNNAEDAWVRQVSFRHFAGSAVFINETVKRVTVEDCIATAPVSEIGGQRRNTFFTRGQQTLFQRCFSENGYHDYSVGHAAAGPNAFVQCVAERPYSFSGTAGMWASGVLFDIMQVDGNAIRVGNRGQDGRGAGWSGANCFFWNCSAALIECDKPPTAQNWSYGSWSEFAGNGFWAESNNHMSPRSFYYTQLQQRLQKDVADQAAILDMGSEASSSPSVEVAQQLTKEAGLPKVEMKTWILNASSRNAISTGHGRAVAIKIVDKGGWSVARPAGIELKDGLLKFKNTGVLAAGKIQEVPWWSGGVEARDLQQARQKMAITRFVPGRSGAGVTDDLQAVADSMKAHHIVALNQHYGLWYDRRRDDHERIRRMSGDVWPPFYELPFARSGKDTAWDGLSKYDLTKYNSWYWDRMKTFADLADQQGLVLLHQNYFQHNIIEAGAHYADFPWRTANNINNTGFVEPVNYAGDKRIFYAEQFYDVSQPVRRQLHQQYINQCLNNFKDNASVIQFASEEFTGPLHFVEFWLETIGNWKKSHQSSRQLIGLSATKDVQDAILSNPKYASVVDVIDIKYWHYQADGTLYAPTGGKNLAPRQWARLLKPKSTSFDQVYRAVKTYREQYPDKAVMYSGDGYDRYGWAVFIAGGSLPALPQKVDQEFLKAAAKMQPSEKVSPYALAGKEGMILYVEQGGPASVDLSAMPGEFTVRFIDDATGALISEKKSISGGAKTQITFPPNARLAWLTR